MPKSGKLDRAPYSATEDALAAFELEAQRLARKLTTASGARERASAARGLAHLRAKIREFIGSRGDVLEDERREYLGVAINEIDNTIAALGRASQRGTA